MARVTLSAELQDAAHGRPVVQGLKQLAKESNDHAVQLASLIARVGAIKVPSIAAIKATLQATGSDPINPPFIPGGSGTSGGVILYGTHGDRLALVTAKTAVGTLFIETDRYALYEWTTAGWVFLGNILGPLIGTRLGPDTRPSDLGTGDVGFIFQASDANGAWWKWTGTAWVFQVGTGVPIEVTLNPSTVPSLGVNDAGFGIWATDYHRFYLWTGAVWAEGEHNDARYQIGFFNAVPDQLGWFLCNGGTVKQSLTNATVLDYTTPNLTGLFLRADSAPGGTGGTTNHLHSVNPPVTTSAVPAPNTSDPPSATVEVDNTLAGSTVFVGTDTHTHDLANHTHDVDIAAFDSALADNIPPYYNVLAYIRL